MSIKSRQKTPHTANRTLHNITNKNIFFYTNYIQIKAQKYEKKKEEKNAKGKKCI